MNAAINAPGAERRVRCQRYEVADMRQASAITGGSRGQEGKRAGLWRRQLSKGSEWERKLNFREWPLLKPCVATVQVHG